MRPVDAAPIDDHDDLFAGFAKRGHHLVDRLAQLLGIKVGDDFREDLRGAIVDGTDDAEQTPLVMRLQERYCNHAWRLRDSSRLI
jgi:hypothetical protein